MVDGVYQQSAPEGSFQHHRQGNTMSAINVGRRSGTPQRGLEGPTMGVTEYQAAYGEAAGVGAMNDMRFPGMTAGHLVALRCRA